MSTQLASLIIEYAKTLPAWQKILAKVAFDIGQKDLASCPEVDLAISRLLFEAKLSDKEAGEEQIKFIDGLSTLGAATSNSIPVLKEIRECKQVNALTEGQKITFAPKLTIIYGENGSGKSGYARVLNSVFFSRGDSQILPNILKPKQEHGAPSAIFEFEANGVKLEKKFPADSASSEFKQFACFDSSTVPVHLEDSNELYVMPIEMSFFERLAALVGLAEKRLTEFLQKRQKENPFVVMFEGESPLKIELSNVSEKSDLTALRKFQGDKDQLTCELQDIEKRFHELMATDPKKAVAELKLVRAELEAYSAAIKIYFERALSSESILGVKKAIDRKRLAELNALKAGADSFKTELLKIVGTPTWRSFISSASGIFAEEAQVRGVAFPGAGDSCPLCLQKLEAGALNLLARYEEFLRGAAEKEMKDAAKEIERLTAAYDPSRLVGLESKRRFASWIEKSLPSEREVFIKLDGEIRAAFLAIYEATKSGDASKVADLPEAGATDRLTNVTKKLDEMIASFDEAAYGKKQAELQAATVLARHRVKLVEKMDEVEKYWNGIVWNAGASKVCVSISTRAITDKQKKIFEEYFTKQYRQLFFKEASHLHVNFQIDVKQRGTAGKTLRKLDVLSYSPADVLSEGEQRAIALADFLTEVQICGLSGGLVFDDPVNSMDHERKAYIARRLVAEAKGRQIIVFTHDISFLFDLVNEAERNGLEEKKDVYCHWIQKLDDRVGLVNIGHRKELELDYKTHARAEDCWKRAKDESDPGQRELISKHGFDCLRKTYEAFILADLFGDTVRRFDRRIKYDTLKKVYCPKPISDFVCDKLGYCSGFVSGHLQADGYSGETASPDLLKREIDAFIEFRRKYKAEKEAALA